MSLCTCLCTCSTFVFLQCSLVWRSNMQIYLQQCALSSVTMFSTAPSFRSSHSYNIYSIVSTRMQWHSKIITFSEHQFVIGLGLPYEIVYYFVLPTSYKIVLRRSIFISDRPFSCVYLFLSVTDVLVRLRPFDLYRYHIISVTKQTTANTYPSIKR